MFFYLRKGENKMEEPNTKFELQANQDYVFTFEGVNFEVKNLTNKKKKIYLEIK
jgi:hypothetical protein